MNEPTSPMTTPAGAPDPRRSVSDHPRGSIVNRYVILDTLGKGAMGAVFSAYDPQLDRRVALKFLRAPAHIDNAQASEDQHEWRLRLQREAQAMARLSHPNVVTLYDTGVSEDGRVFLAMEFVEGGTLREWLENRKRSWREIVDVFCQAGQGLAAAHRAGLIHRDFKLENVLMGEDGRPRVTDFGLARSVENDPSQAPMKLVAVAPSSFASAASLSNALTMTGLVLGTPGYMAPEQYGGDNDIDARVDVFAFCASLYKALYGERAFPGEGVEEIAESTLNGVVRPAPRASDVPMWVRRILLRGLSVDRAARPGSMEEMLAALRADPAHRRTRWLAACVAGAVACLGWLTVHAASERRERVCRAAGAPVYAVWSSPHKAAIRTAFLSTGLAYADDTWSKVERSLDSYAMAWSRSSEEACVATRIRGAQSETMLELRTACLGASLDEMQSLYGVLEHADAKTVENAADAARSLSPLERCSNFDQLSAATRLPEDGAIRSEIRALRSAVARAKVLNDAGKAKESQEQLHAVGERVLATRYEPLAVAWRLRLADAEKVAGDTKTAATDYGQVIRLADAQKLDAERAAALLELGGLEDLRARYDESHERLQAASAVIARLGGDPALELRRDATEGWVYLDEEKVAQALPMLERGLSRAREGQVRDPQTIARAEGGLSTAFLFQGSFDKALEHADIAMRTIAEAYGELHPLMALELNNLASIDLETGRTDDALAAASRAMTLFQQVADRGEISTTAPSLALGAQTLGEVLLRAGLAREAAVQLRRAREGYRAADEQRDNVAMVDNELAEAEYELHHPAEANAALDEAKEISLTVKGLAPTTLAATLAVRAKLSIERHQAADALGLAEKAMSIQAQGTPFVYEAADMQLLVARALVLTGHDAGRAEHLAEQARDGFAKVHDRQHVDEASALLRDARRTPGGR